MKTTFSSPIRTKDEASSLGAVLNSANVAVFAGTLPSGASIPDAFATVQAAPTVPSGVYLVLINLTLSTPNAGDLYQFRVMSGGNQQFGRNIKSVAASGQQEVTFISQVVMAATGDLTLQAQNVADRGSIVAGEFSYLIIKLYDLSGDAVYT